MTGTSGYLLDTNVISETRKSRADAGVIAFLSAADSKGLYLSVLTLGELRKGVAAKRRTDMATGDQLSLWVDGIEANFTDRLLSIDPQTARLWGEFSAGRRLPAVDTLIAATAMNHGLTLVTRNIRDIESTGVRLMDPWTVKS